MVDFWTALIRGLAAFEKKGKDNDPKKREQTKDKNRP
jgi:hypothetical protein